MGLGRRALGSEGESLSGSGGRKGNVMTASIVVSV